jgi:hypothetical protein
MRNLVVMIMAIFVTGFVSAQRATEYQVKAAFLYNFTKFLEWPPAAIGSPSEPFVVGILGADPFGTHLTEIVAGESAFGKPIVIRHFSEPASMSACHILYINLPGRTAEAVKALYGKPVLTVSDDPDFCANGGIMRFFPENEMIRLEISPTAAKASNLIISSKLMRIAKLCQ